MYFVHWNDSLHWRDYNVNFIIVQYNIWTAWLVHLQIRCCYNLQAISVVIIFIFLIGTRDVICRKLWCLTFLWGTLASIKPVMSGSRGNTTPEQPWSQVASCAVPLDSVAVRLLAISGVASLGTGSKQLCRGTAVLTCSVLPWWLGTFRSEYGGGGRNSCSTLQCEPQVSLMFLVV